MRNTNRTYYNRVNPYVCRYMELIFTYKVVISLQYIILESKYSNRTVPSTVQIRITVIVGFINCHESSVIPEFSYYSNQEGRL